MQTINVMQIYESKERFPIDFDDFWKWCEYSTKQKAEKTLLNNFKEGKDFLTFGLKSSTGGRKSKDIRLSIECAKSFAMLAQTPKGREVRDYFLEIEDKLKNLELFNKYQIAYIMRLIEFFKYVQYQIEAEEAHKQHFILNTKERGNLHALFYEYRNRMLGINNEVLKQEVLKSFLAGETHSPKAKNIRSRIFVTDPYQLVYNAIVDFLISKGEDMEMAKKFAQMVKEVCQINEVELADKNQTNLFREKEKVGSFERLLLESKNNNQSLF